MAGKNEFLTDEQAIALVNNAVALVKQTLGGLPSLGNGAAVRSHLLASLGDLKQALAALVTRI